MYFSKHKWIDNCRIGITIAHCKTTVISGSCARVCLFLPFAPAGGYFYAQQGGSHAV
jgi:hypothetical protein